MKRRLVPLLMICVVLVLVSGCIPQLKDPSQFTTPSWNVPVTVPIIKTTVNFGEKLVEMNNSEDIVVKDNVFSLFQSLPDNMKVFDMPDIAKYTEQLAFDPEPWESDPGINMDYAFTSLGTIDFVYNYAPVGMPLSSDYSEAFGFFTTPFGRARLSDSPANAVHVTVTTTTAIADAMISLIDVKSGQIYSSAPFDLNSGQLIVDIPLANAVLQDQLDLRIAFTPTVESGQVTVKMDEFTNFHVTEVDGFVLGDLNFALPELTLPELKPLAPLPLLKEIKLKSGTITITQSTFAVDGKEFPFTVTPSSLALSDGTNTYSFVKIGDSWVLNLTGVSLNPNTALQASFNVNFTGLTYDVYEDATGEVKPYSYDFGVAMENLEVDYIEGDIHDIAGLTENPNTPGLWEYRLDDQSTELMELDLPGNAEDINLGLNTFELYLEVDNQTSLVGDINIRLTTYQDASGLTVDKFQDLTLKITSKDNVSTLGKNIFDFKNNPTLSAQLQGLVDIINSKPKYYKLSYSGGIGYQDSIKLSFKDYIQPSGHVYIPIAFSVGPGGATIPQIMPETEFNDPSQRNVIKQVNEFIDKATLNIKYENGSTLGVGGVFTFKGAGKTVVKEVVLLPHDPAQPSNTIILTVDQELFDVLASETGYTISMDLKIPNTSATEWKTMALKADDKISVTVWVDGVVKAHVPGQM